RPHGRKPGRPCQRAHCGPGRRHAGRQRRSALPQRQSQAAAYTDSVTLCPIDGRRRWWRCSRRRSCRRGNPGMKTSLAKNALKPEHEGVLAVLNEQSTIDRVQGVIRELQLDDELTVIDTLDAALQRMRSGSPPRVLLLDLGESPAPIAEVSAARAV